jgi:hypothetical protein
MIPTAVSAQQTPTEGRIISDLALPATVLVYSNTTATLHCDLTSQGGSVFDQAESDAGFGSGFFVNPNGYILTDGHVVNALTSADPNSDIAVKSDMVSTLTSQIVAAYAQEGVTVDPTQLQPILMQNCQVTGATTVTTVILGTSQASGIQPAPLPAVTVGTPSPFDQRDFALLKVDLQNTPSLLLGDSSTVQTGDTVYAMGFPGVVVENPLLNPNQMLEPTFTSGTISGSRQTSSGNPVFGTDVTVTHGNSGGPVLNSKGLVIGLVDFGSVNPNTGQEVSGFNFITQSSAALDYLRENGVSNSQGPTDALYAKGLAYLYAGLYGSAVASFQSVLNSYAYQWHAKDLITQAQSQINSNALALPQISVAPAQNQTTQGTNVEVTGSISYAVPTLPVQLNASASTDWSKVQLTLTYTSSSGNTVTHQVVPNSDGTFSDTFTPQSSGSWTITATSSATSDFKVAKGTASLTVSAASMLWLYAVVGAAIVVVLALALFVRMRMSRKRPQTGQVSAALQ